MLFCVTNNGGRVRDLLLYAFVRRPTWWPLSGSPQRQFS